MNAINSTNSAKSDEKIVGKYYRVSCIIDQAMKPSGGSNALVLIQPDVMAKGMGSSIPLEINIWLTADEFEKIGGISSVGKQIDLSVKLTNISRNAMSRDPDVKGYPIQLEFGEYDYKQQVPGTKTKRVVTKNTNKRFVKSPYKYLFPSIKMVNYLLATK